MPERVDCTLWHSRMSLETGLLVVLTFLPRSHNRVSVCMICVNIEVCESCSGFYPKMMMLLESSCVKLVASKAACLVPCGVVALPVGHWTCNSQVTGSSSAWTPLCSGLMPDTYACLPLSPSSITWYRSRDGDALRLGR